MGADINWVGALVAGISAFAVGAVWYGPLFGKAWQKLVGLKDAELEKGMAKTFGLSFVLTLVIAFSLAFFIGNESTSFGFFAGFVAGFAWVAAALGVNNLFEHRPLKLYLINAGYNVVIFSLMGAIIGAF